MKNGSQRIGLSDMMTGLMLIFLLISILSIYEVQQRELVKDEIVDQYYSKREVILDDLHKTFEEKKVKRDLSIDDDLTIKFNNPDILFAYKSHYINSNFRKILDEFIPLYTEVINKKEYRHLISEIRIEGHTAGCEDDYIGCITLSHNRAKSVLEYIHQSNSFKALPKEDLDQINFWMMAIGMSYGRALDIDGNYIIDSDGEISANSRRVEFKIVTKSEELIEQINNL